MQDKLSRDADQMDLLTDLLNLQKDMMVMLLSMLEGNILNGPIGKQMVDTLMESQVSLEMILKFFDTFLKLANLTSSEAFMEIDLNGDGFVSPKELRSALVNEKTFTGEEIEYILLCVDANQDGKIDITEFTERFHNPAKEIGFNVALLLTNLSEHITNDARLDRFVKNASSFLNYFEPYLGRIEILGKAGRIERVYFEITEANIDQWEKPQIKESKQAYIFSSVNEGGDGFDEFINFAEDTIFEMQHAASISTEEEEEQARMSEPSPEPTVTARKTSQSPFSIRSKNSSSWRWLKFCGF
jgi:ryanodine receptor 2